MTWSQGEDVPDEATLVGQDHRLHPVTYPELGEHASDVRLHRRLRDDELSSDLGVGEAAGHQPEHLRLALREFRERLWKRWIRHCWSGIPLDEAPGDRRLDERLPARRGAHRRQEPGGRSVLEEEAVGAGS